MLRMQMIGVATSILRRDICRVAGTSRAREAAGAGLGTVSQEYIGGFTEARTCEHRRF